MTVSEKIKGFGSTAYHGYMVPAGRGIYNTGEYLLSGAYNAGAYVVDGTVYGFNTYVVPSAEYIASGVMNAGHYVVDNTVYGFNNYVVPAAQYVATSTYNGAAYVAHKVSDTASDTYHYFFPTKEVHAADHHDHGSSSTVSSSSYESISETFSTPEASVSIHLVGETQSTESGYIS